MDLIPDSFSCFQMADDILIGKVQHLLPFFEFMTPRLQALETLRAQKVQVAGTSMTRHISGSRLSQICIGHQLDHLAPLLCLDIDLHKDNSVIIMVNGPGYQPCCADQGPSTIPMPGDQAAVAPGI
jgi:hypothetical protein